MKRNDDVRLSNHPRLNLLGHQKNIEISNKVNELLMDIRSGAAMMQLLVVQIQQSRHAVGLFRQLIAVANAHRGSDQAPLNAEQAVEELTQLRRHYQQLTDGLSKLRHFEISVEPKYFTAAVDTFYNKYQTVFCAYVHQITLNRLARTGSMLATYYGQDVSALSEMTNIIYISQQLASYISPEGPKTVNKIEIRGVYTVKGQIELAMQKLQSQLALVRKANILSAWKHQQSTPTLFMATQKEWQAEIRLEMCADNSAAGKADAAVERTNDNLKSSGASQSQARM